MADGNGGINWGVVVGFIFFYLLGWGNQYFGVHGAIDTLFLTNKGVVDEVARASIERHRTLGEVINPFDGR